MSLIAVCLVMVLFIGMRASGDTLIVDDDGGAWADYTKIQDAVNASAGTDIYIYEGVYNESVEVNNTCTFRGNGSGITIVNGTDYAFNISIDDAYIQSMSISAVGHAIQVNANGSEITYCEITWSDHAIHLVSCNNFSINNNTISDVGDGIWVEGGEGGEIIDNDISPGWSDPVWNAVYGIYVTNHNITVRDNHVNWSRDGIYVNSPYSALIESNTIDGFKWEGIILNGDGHNIINNTIWGDTSDPQTAFRGLYIMSARNLVLTGNVMHACGVYLRDTSLGFMNSHTLDNNTVNGEEILYMIGNSSETISEDWGQIFVIGCSNITLESMAFHNVSAGIQIAHCTNVTLVDIEAWGCFDAVSGYMTTDLTFTDCLFGFSSYGIHVSQSGAVLVENITTMDCVRGIDLRGTTDYWVYDSKLIGGYVGFELAYVDNGLLSNNTNRDNSGTAYRFGSNTINATVIGGNITVFYHGIDIEQYASEISILNTTMSDVKSSNAYGIWSRHSSNVTVDGSFIYDAKFGAYFDNDESPTVRNVTFSGTDYAIYGTYCGNLSFIDNTIVHPTFLTQYAIVIEYGAGGEILDNNISNADYGIYITGNDALVKGNRMERLSYGYTGIRMYDSNATLSENTIIDHNFGISLTMCDGNVISDNEVRGSAVTGIDLVHTTNLTLRANDMFGCSFDIQGNELWYYDSHDLQNNTVNGLDILIMIGNDTETIDDVWGQVILVDCSDIVLANMAIDNASSAVKVVFSTDITFDNHTARMNARGIDVSYSTGVIIDGLITEDNTFAINIDFSDSITISGFESKDDSWGMKSYRVTGILVEDSIFNGTGPALQIQNECDDIVIDNITISEVLGDGITFNYASNITIEGGWIDSSNRGIYASNTENLSVNGTTFYRITTGLQLVDSYNISVTHAIINRTDHGVKMEGSSWTSIINNTFLSNPLISIHCDEDAHNNTIYWNQIIDGGASGSQATDDGTDNVWDNGSAGNWWSDYPGEDADRNGIGDDPYEIDGTAGSQDDYPLVEIVNSPPELVDGAVSASLGTPATMFNYTVTYSDYEGVAATDMIVFIDANPFDMTAAATGNWTTGWEFYYETTLLSGDHTFNFTASDGVNWNTTGNFTGPHVTTIPELSSGTIDPEDGNESVWFTFNVTYTDEDNDAPAWVNITIGNETYSMSQIDAGDTDYTDGADFNHSRYLSIGNIYYNFSASDGYYDAFLVGGNITVNESDEPIKPIAVIDLIEPMLARQGWVVNFTGYGSGGEIVGWNWTSDVDDFITGVAEFNTSTLSAGQHNISFTVLNDDGLWSDPDTGVVRINSPPELANVAITPEWGNDTTVFTIYAEFVDADFWDASATHMYIYIDGDTSSMMLVENTTNHYYFNTTLDHGTHMVWIIGYDGLERTYDDVYYVRVNRPPSLSGASIDPVGGNESMLFTFDVTYSDQEGDEPSSVLIEIDGNEYPMNQADAGDTNYTDGALFTYETLLNAGNHTFNFSASDGLEDYWLGGGVVSVNESDEPIKPIAYIDSVEPNPADLGDPVRFRGHGSGGVIVEYDWTSSIDGALEDSDDFNVSTLSEGAHHITLRVRNDDDLWSDVEFIELEIIAPEFVPDLEVLGVTILPEDPNDKDEISISIRMTNPGNKNGTFEIGVYYHDANETYASPADLTEIAMINITIEPGVTEMRTVTWTADVGEYEIVVWGDPGMEIVELSEMNNIADETVTVSEAPDDEDKAGELDPAVAAGLFLIVVLVLIALFFLMKRSPRKERPVEDGYGEEGPYDDEMDEGPDGDEGFTDDPGTDDSEAPMDEGETPTEDAGVESDEPPADKGADIPAGEGGEPSGEPPSEDTGDDIVQDEGMKGDLPNV